MERLAGQANLTRGNLRNGAGVILLSFLALGARLATPSSVAVAAILRANPSKVIVRQSGAPEGMLETPSTQTATGTTTAPRHHSLPDKPGLPKGDGDNTHEISTQPSPGRSEPSDRPFPRPLVHHHPHYAHTYPNYVWNRGNVRRLRHYFHEDIRNVNKWHRRRLFAGRYFPPRYVDYIQPIPPSLMVYLPPVPPRYRIGYFDGYCFVYDPRTLMVVSVVDLCAS